MQGTDVHKSLRDRRNNTEAADIGEIPAVTDIELRKKAEDDVVWFCENCCASLFRHAMPPILQDYARSLVEAVTKGENRLIMLPRGSGKTSIIEAVTLYLVATCKVAYPVIICVNQSSANQLLRNIWATVENNKTFLDLFPEVAHPVVSLQGMVQRCASQHIRGNLTHIKLGSNTLKFADVNGRIGATISARGAGGSIRGLVTANGSRPDFAIVDDPQKRATAKSTTSVQKLMDFLLSDVKGLAGNDRTISICITATPICAGDLCDAIIKTNTFDVIKHTLIVKPPKHTDLWEDFIRLYRDDLAEKTTTAIAFYKANRNEMDEGAEVLDPLGYAPSQVSALARAYMLRAEIGEGPYRAEYALDPITQTTEIALEPLTVASRLSQVPRRVVPQELSAIVAGIDVGSATSLHITLTAFGRGQKASVIDAYQYPPKGRLVPKGTPEAVANKLLTSALAKVVADILSTKYLNELGKRIPIYGICIDRGWNTETVDAVVRHFTRLTKPVYAIKGYPADRYYPSKHTLAKADHIDLRETDGKRYLAQDSDHYKALTLDSFNGAPLTQGTLCLWGNSGGDVLEVAQQICGEKLLEKIVSSKGTMIYRWAASSAGAQNHYLDSTSMTLALATYLRLRDGETVSSIIAQTQTQSTPQTQSPNQPSPQTSIQPKPKPKSKHRIRLH